MVPADRMGLMVPKVTTITVPVATVQAAVGVHVAVFVFSVVMDRTVPAGAIIIAQEAMDQVVVIIATAMVQVVVTITAQVATAQADLTVQAVDVVVACFVNSKLTC